MLAGLCTATPGRSETFPVAIATEFGETVIDQEPQRVVSISLIGHDFLLALGVIPTALRKWYGPDRLGVWVWAQDDLGGAEPVVMMGEIDVEQIALLEPDLIEAQWSGITEKEYRLLSKIAPTLGPKPGAGDYGTSWTDMLLRLGRATGTQDVAKSRVDQIEARFAAVREAHPEWQGATATMAWAGSVGAYTAEDLRGQFLEDLGFVIPEDVTRLIAGNRYYVTVPTEDVSPLDADVLVWLDTGGSISKLHRLPLRPTMRAFKQGREVYADPLLSAALSHSSPQSLDYALDRLVPLFEAAMDGDPATPVPSTLDVGLAPNWSEDD